MLKLCLTFMAVIFILSSVFKNDTYNMKPGITMKKFLTLFVIVVSFCHVTYAQQFTKEKVDQNLITNQIPQGIGTQALQQYYQNVYRDREQQFQQTFMPSFDIDKTRLIEKLKETIPLEGPIDAEIYLIGPGDMLQVDVWSAVPFSYPVIINPEGSAVIPTVGVVEVAGKSLLAAKQAIAKAVRNVYIKGEITVTLIAPRIFAVTVSGIVNNPGTFYASAVQRADQVIYQANLKAPGLTSMSSMVEQENRRLLERGDALKYYRSDELQQQQPLEFSLRNIRIIRRTGDTLAVDLVRYYATGSTRYNPFLYDGDRIIVPNLNLDGNSISITGAVRLEGTYEFVAGDSLSHVFEIAQGPTGFADLHHIDLYRTEKSQNQYRHERIDYAGIVNRYAPDVALKPGDRIVVRQHSMRETPFSVTVKGEVEKQGLYPITFDRTKLSEIITAAGGFTPNASLANARVIRFSEPLDKLESNPDYIRLYNMRLSDMGIFDREYFNLEALLQRNQLSIDFQQLFLKVDSTQDIILRDGDMILIPQDQNTVLVLGQVPRPGQLQFVSGKNYNYYIEQAGGITNRAEKSEIRIIKAGSKNWHKPNKTKIEPGDTVWIPRKRDIEFDTYLDWVAKIAGVLGSIATIILLVNKY